MDAIRQETGLQAGKARGTATMAGVAIAILICSYAINGMDRVLFPLLLTDVRREYGFGLPEAGLMSTIFTLGMALAGLPTGCWLARVYGWTTAANVQLVLLCVIAAAVSLLVQAPPASKASAS